MNVFLTAEWRKLINLTYEVEPSLLESYLPKGVELDTQLNGKAHVSLVAFDFLNTRLKGIKIPMHVHFPEVNLRFYVRYNGQVGVVFIRELVPRFCIAYMARRLYNEPYSAVPMHSEVIQETEYLRVHHTFDKQAYEIDVQAQNVASVPAETSVDQYFKEHSWGFGTSHSGRTLCYYVEHPVWEVYPVLSHRLKVDFGVLYGQKWAFLNHTEPTYRLLAEGSAVKVYHPMRLDQMPV